MCIYSSLLVCFGICMQYFMKFITDLQSNSCIDHIIIYTVKRLIKKNQKTNVPPLDLLLVLNNVLQNKNKNICILLENKQHALICFT